MIYILNKSEYICNVLQLIRLKRNSHTKIGIVLCSLPYVSLTSAFIGAGDGTPVLIVDTIITTQYQILMVGKLHRCWGAHAPRKYAFDLGGFIWIESVKKILLLSQIALSHCPPKARSQNLSCQCEDKLPMSMYLGYPYQTNMSKQY